MTLRIVLHVLAWFKKTHIYYKDVSFKTAAHITACAGIYLCIPHLSVTVLYKNKNDTFVPLFVRKYVDVFDQTVKHRLCDRKP